MSDFIFSKVENRQLGETILSIYDLNPPTVHEFHGDYGSLAVTKSTYFGFDPLETDSHICVVVGGPALMFDYQTDNNSKTQLIFDRWHKGSMKWDTDLSGPFAIAIVEKQEQTVTIVTDLLSFVPIFHSTEEDLTIGTHVDVVASVSGLQSQLDEVSIADFIAHQVVTFPHTVYEGIRQTPPGSVLTYSNSSKEVAEYWKPVEKYIFRNIEEAALVLRLGFENFLEAGSRPEIA